MAVSRALMLRVAAGELAPTLRIARPGPAVVFGRRDAVGAGYRAAVDAARGAGFEAVERLAGGHAAVFHGDTISLAHAVADSDPRTGITARFERTAAVVARALGELGVDARVGEVPGEYCAGEHSVNAAGARKLAGLGQRLVRGGVHTGAVIVVGGADRVRHVLVPVYSALGLDWDPATVGSVAAEVPGTSWAQAVQALIGAYTREYELEPAEIDPETLELATSLALEHRSPEA